jgi:hypothetical protein
MGNRRFPEDHPMRFLHAQIPHGPDVWWTFDLHELTDDEIWGLGFDELSDAELRAQGAEIAEVHLTLEQWRCLARHRLDVDGEIYEGLWVWHPLNPHWLVQTERGQQMPCLAFRLPPDDVATLRREMGLPTEDLA